MRQFWYFDVPVWSGEKKLCLSGFCQNGDLAPYCKDWEPRYPQNTSKRLQFPWIPLRYHPDTPRYPQTPPTHPRDTLQTSPLQRTQHANRQQQTPIDTARHTQTAPVSVLGCLAVSVRVCWQFVLPGDVWGVFGVCLWGVWGVSGGIWVVFMEIIGAWMCLGGNWVLSPCSMEPKHHFGRSLKSTIFFPRTILRHQNTKIAAYQLSKNDWAISWIF